MVLADCFGSEGWTSPSLPILLRGANLINTLQLMLLQADGEEILIAPAWPEGWDVEFKLHAPASQRLLKRPLSSSRTTCNLKPSLYLITVALIFSS